MPSPPLDYLIVGQGLAGSLLGWELLHLGAHIGIIDSRYPHAAFPVAAGILNPVTGKRIVKSWKVDSLLPDAVQCYQTLKKAFGTEFYQAKTILRLFENEGERELWTSRKEDPEYEDWLGDTLPPGHFGSEIKDPFGSFEITGGGWLSMRGLVQALEKHFEKRNVLIRSPFRYEELDLEHSDDTVQWRDFNARKIIFCEGYRGSDNPWFNWLDYRLSKGEVLDVETGNSFPDYILNKGKWILPTGECSARVGATYSWDALESGPSITGMAELMKDLKSISNGKFPVAAHRSGIRPGTNDSRPYLGTHPLDSRLVILGGFGSKGSLYGPGAARELAQHLQSGKSIDEEWDVRRRLKFLKDPLKLP